MTTAQKIIKYLAIAFAMFLVFTIISSILGGIYGLAGVLGLKKNTNTENVEIGTKQSEQIQELTTYLDIDINYSNLTIKTGEDFVVQSSNNDIKYAQEGNKFKVKEKGHIKFSGTAIGDVVIYIPKELVFETVDIDTGAGTVDIETLRTDNLILNLGAGETTIKNIISNKTKIDTGAGKLRIKSGNINDLDFDMGVGETDITAKLTGTNKIDTGIGNLKLQLLGDKQDYKFNISKGIGEVKIEDKSIIEDQTIGDGKNNIIISGGVGQIKVGFIENKDI